MASGEGKGVLEATSASLRDDMAANYVGAALTTIAFIPLLQSSPKQGPAKIVVISSALGSAGVLPHLPDGFKAFAAGYSASKAAINMWARKLAYALADGSANVPREGGWAVGLVSSWFRRSSLTLPSADPLPALLLHLRTTRGWSGPT